MLNYSFCVFGSVSTIEDEVLDAVQIAFSTLMCFLVTIRFIKESLQMYKVTKQFEVNRYMKQIARDGMVYFLAYVHVSFYSPISLPSNWANNVFL